MTDTTTRDESQLNRGEAIQGSPFEVFRVFLKLGLTSFGGPIAHLGYFRDELVVRRKWIDEAGYADLVARSQFLPGPASSQVGFLPGLLLVYGMLPFWDALRLRPAAQAAMRGANAAVVGILGAALYNPVWTSALLSPPDFAVALAGFLLLTVWKAQPWIVVVLLAASGTLLHLI